MDPGRRSASPGLLNSGDCALTNMMTTLDPRSRAATRGWSDITIRNLFIIPTVAFLIIFNVFPLLYSLGFSFTDFRASSKDPVNFVGFKNYVDVLADPVIWRTFTTTLWYVIVSVSRPVRRRLRARAAAQPQDPVQGPDHDAAAASDDAVAGGGRACSGS